MVHFFKDMLSFLQTLSFIDYILYFTVLVLIVLIISLIYVIRMSDDDEMDIENIDEKIQEQTIKLSDSITNPANITSKLERELPNDIIDLKEIVNTIDEKPTPVIDMTAYEAEQEEKAIISYEELISSTKSHPINYDTEEMVDDTVKVKKINLENLTNVNITEDPPRLEVKLFTYDHEEAFLKTLKQLNELLN